MFALRISRVVMKTFSLKSPAKINLGLRVLQLRSDGYHNIESVFVAIDLFDDLEFSQHPSVHVECSVPITTRQEDNLVFKAAMLMQHSTHTQLGAKILLTKRIPFGAGLGGGSSNAATTLVGLNKLWGLNLPLSRLRYLAEQLGSDVPFFLHTPVALVQGRGELCTPLPLSMPWTIVVINTHIHISTKNAYEWLDATLHYPQLSNNLGKVVANLINNQPSTHDEFAKNGGMALGNDFEQAVQTELPALSTIKNELVSNGAVFASLTGSGSAIYGLFTDVDTAMAATAITALAPYQSYICTPITHGVAE